MVRPEIGPNHPPLIARIIEMAWRTHPEARYENDVIVRTSHLKFMTYFHSYRPSMKDVESLVYRLNQIEKQF